MTAWDQGRSAARNGLPKKANPFDRADRQRSGSAWERKASEWNEGWESYDAAQDSVARSQRARNAANARWTK